MAKIQYNGYKTSSSIEALDEIQKGNLAFFTPTFDFLGKYSRPIYNLYSADFTHTNIIDPEAFCKVRMIGERLKDGFLSMAIRKSKLLLLPLIVSAYDEHTDSPHREALNKGITKIQANGVLDSIRQKWIRYSDRNCEKVNKLFLSNSNLINFTQVTQSQLTLHNIGGCFIILAVGACLALLNSTIFSKNTKGFNKKF